MASNVPKFASFRPKPKPASELPKEHQTASLPVPRRSKEHKCTERAQSPPTKKQKLEEDTAASKTYFSDRRGDSDVLKYGALNRYDVPSYRRYGYGYVLGLDTSQKIDRERSSDTRIYLTSAKPRRQERLLTNKRIARESSRTLRFIEATNVQSHSANEDFIAIRASRRSLENSDDDDDGNAHDREQPFDTSYRSIDAKPKSEQPVDPETQYDSDTGTLSVSLGVTTRNSELVRKTRECPKDVQAWLNFIDHQEAMITLDLPMTELNDATRLQLSDVRIPIYEEALKKVGSNPENHIKLYKGLFKEAQRSWNEAKLASRYKEVLTKHPGSTDIWFMYLNFVQSSFTQFKYETCLAAFIQCLKAIKDDASGMPIETLLHVFIRMTSMIHEAGYQELALGLWQAVLERHLSQSRFDTTQSFEDFWDSEAPRIGEEGATGWKSASSDDLSPPDAKSLQQKTSSDSIYEDFSKREVDAINKLRYPGRTSDDVGEDDAFHTVLYADIKEYLGFIPIGTSIVLIVEAFLCFCGLPSFAHVAEHFQAWWEDPFLANRTPASTLSPECPQSELGNDFERKTRRFAACSLMKYQMVSDLLFGQSFSLEGIQLSADFVRRLLRLTNVLHPDDVLAEYLLAFELHHYPSEVSKSAKQLLKSRPTSQRLYHAYGLAEAGRGNHAKASQVFSMALSLGEPHRYISSVSLTLLNSWVWEALLGGDQIEALWRLVSPSGKLPARPDAALLPNQTTLGGTREMLSETCEHALLNHDYASAVICTSLLALLAYLSSQHNAELALTIYRNLTNYFTSHKLLQSPWSELHAQSICRFLAYHAAHAPIIKPAQIRTALEPLVAIFPDNTIILSLYAANESRFAIDDRVRGIMHQSALESSGSRSASSWSFAINFERLRGEIAGSTSHSIRALFKRATSLDASGAHCPALWSAYLHFELKQLEVEQEKCKRRSKSQDGKKRGWELGLEEAENRVKETFYAGLRRLPWCKDFIMLAFTNAKGMFGEEELGKVYGVMLEKEIRVYVEIE